MKHRLVFILLISLMIYNSCKENPDYFKTDKTIIAGQIIDDSTFSEITLLTIFPLESPNMIKIYPNQKGNFKYSFNLPTEIEFSLLHDDLFSTLLIAPGDSIYIQIDRKNDPEIIFKGDSSSYFNDMYALHKIFYRLIRPYGDLVKRIESDSPEQFMKYRTKLFNDNIDSLKIIFNKKSYPARLKQLYESKFRLIYGNDLFDFLRNYSLDNHIYIRKDNIPSNYFKVFDSIYIASINDYGLIDYLHFLSNFTYYLSFEIKDSLVIAAKNRDKVLSAKISMDYYENFFTGFQLDYLVTSNLIRLIDEGNINDETFNKYHNILTNDYFKSFLTKKYSEYKLILNTSLDTSKIKTFDISISDTISLSKTIIKNHIGKTLYVDIWATWCGPCLSSFAYLPQLKKSLLDEHIEYIYLAVSSQQDQWKKIINSYKIEGYHYLLNTRQGKELHNMINFSSIPHYFIINKAGKIIIPDAKRPFDSELIKQLKDLK